MTQRTHLLGVLLLCSYLLRAQVTPSNFVLGHYPAERNKASYTLPGFLASGTGMNYGANYNFTLNYGTTDGTSPGFNRIVKTFQVSGQTYTLTKAVPGAKPFKSVTVKRLEGSTGEKITALFEAQNPPDAEPNTVLNLVPDYVGTMEDLINSYVINRGTDNVFERKGNNNTTNNIVRIDLVLEEQVIIPANAGDRQKSGFLLMERGANDSFKAAAITGVDGAGNPTSFGNIVNIAANTWGTTGQNMESVVVQKNPGDSDLRASQKIGTQPIAGVFISLDNLGVPAGTTIYGITILENNAIDPENFPTVATLDNGLDFMAGGGFFTKAILIKGKVWIDTNEDAIFDGSTELGTNNGGTIWASLVGPDNKVISSIAVDASGYYTLFVAESQRVAGAYKVILTNTEKREGETLIGSDALLNGYTPTGTNFQNTPDTENESMIINIGALEGRDTDMEGIDFGIIKSVTPVNLVHFSATQVQNEVSLSWTTSSEVNNEGFEVQFSEDGRNWQTQDFVKAKTLDGNSEETTHYSSLHQRPVFGQNYYRLKQIDHDGTFAFSPIRVIKVSISSLVAWPNPSPGSLRVAVSDEQAKQIKAMKIVDMGGRVLKESKAFQEQWDISELRSDAVYLLRVEYKNNFSEQIRIYKR
jgi:hypothetical protein